MNSKINLKITKINKNKEKKLKSKNNKTVKITYLLLFYLILNLKI